MIDHYCHTQYGKHVWDNLIGQAHGPQVESTILEKIKVFLDNYTDIETVYVHQAALLLNKLDQSLIIKPFPETEDLLLESLTDVPTWYLAASPVDNAIIACVLVRSDSSHDKCLFDLSSHKLSDQQKWLLKILEVDYLKGSRVFE